ncbi:DUF6527 family protein [Haliea sp. E1-2-M8]|uniref:DUF6527 family protein n=1 Tax=Haliea sp. E1-2-M8 TaxID=3064706 RepID=UPI002727517F|nr:DUF6527 family protein [Haliea sp. E1-2-M8]MDO8863245.1 DUF6527 family protein [Haliea sp. E1-2-M8]
MKTTRIDYELVEFIPEKLEDGVLYISEPYKTAAHKCACSCGEEVITPLNPTDWKVKIQGGRVSLNPSIGNWSFACRSHYWIRNGEVIWSYALSETEIQQGRDWDKVLKEAYFNKVNEEKGQKPAGFLGKLQAVLSQMITWLRH